MTERKIATSSEVILLEYLEGLADGMEFVDVNDAADIDREIPDCDVS